MERTLIPICRPVVRWVAIGLIAAVVPRVAAQPEVPVLPPEDQRRAADEKLNEQDINLGAADADAARVAEWVAQLGAAEYTRREAASHALAELCPGAFRQLAEVYRTVDDYETHLRIEELVRTQYLWHTLLKHKGFLGVSYQQTNPVALPDGSVAVPIGVQPGTAADEAGLRNQDLIRAIDGQAFTDGNSTAAFRTLIQNKGAGGKVLLDVLRGGQSLRFAVTLRARPIETYEGPELLDELNSRMQAYTLWWGEHFDRPAPHTERTPSTTVLELPE